MMMNVRRFLASTTHNDPTHSMIPLLRWSWIWYIVVGNIELWIVDIDAHFLEIIFQLLCFLDSFLVQSLLNYLIRNTIHFEDFNRCRIAAFLGIMNLIYHLSMSLNRVIRQSLGSREFSTALLTWKMATFLVLLKNTFVFEFFITVVTKRLQLDVISLFLSHFFILNLQIIT